VRYRADALTLQGKSGLVREGWGRLGAAVVMATILVCACGPTTAPASTAAPVAGRSAAAVTAAPLAGGTVTSVIGTSPFITMDPAKADTVVAIEQVFMVFEPLLRFDPVTLRPVPGAARELPTVSADGLSYRLTLRDGLVFSDRTAIRAEDFAFGLSRLCDPSLGASYAAALFAVIGCADWSAMPVTSSPEVLAAGRKRLITEGIRVLSERELEIVLREPASYFTSILALWLAVPIRQRDVERGGANWWADPATLIGNGPFVLSEFTPGERMTFGRNERSRTPAKLEKWTKLIIDDSAKALDAYRNGTADFIRVGAAQRSAVATDAALRRELHVFATAATTILKPNHARPPLDDPNVRLAFAKSFDRGAFVRDIQPSAAVAASFIPLGVPGHDPDDSAQRFDPAAARELLARSRYAGSFPEVIWNYRADRPQAAAQANWFAEQWKRHLGVTITPRAVTFNELQGALRSLTTTPHFEPGTWLMDYPHQHNWLSHWFSADGELAAHNGYQNPEVFQVLRAADREQDARARDALYLRAGRLVSAEAGMIWVSHPTTAILVRPRVRDLHFGPLDEGGQQRPGEVYLASP
jgi:oligopeptide transport system substrate-binding protein